MITIIEKSTKKSRVSIIEVNFYYNEIRKLFNMEDKGRNNEVDIQFRDVYESNLLLFPQL